MRKINKILSEVSKNISLPPKELSALKKGANDLVKKIKSKKLKVFIGGSLAKGTVVQKHGKLDADIFVVYPDEKKISTLGKTLKTMSLPGKLKLVHGSRDYYQVVNENIIYELIPVVENKDPAQALNVTDVSLSHVKYVLGEIKKNPTLANEIRLAKVFCAAQGCYGAESYIGGFSGYALEILVIHFGSFTKFLKGVSNKKVLDPAKNFKNDKEVLLELNASKLQSPLILIDPTYKYRNATAGLHLETFEKFKVAAKDFFKNPNISFFERKDFDVDGMKKYAQENQAVFLKLNLQTNKQEGDIAGTKMKKFFNYLIRELRRGGQEVLSNEFIYSGKGKKSVGYAVVNEKTKIVIRGPSIDKKEAVLAFKAANKSFFEKNGFVCVEKKSSIRNVLKAASKVEKEMSVKLI